MSVAIQQEENDPIAVRVSAGWIRDTPNGYVVYRGTVEEAIHCLRNVLETLEGVKKVKEQWIK